VCEMGIVDQPLPGWFVAVYEKDTSQRIYGNWSVRETNGVRSTSTTSEISGRK